MRRRARAGSGSSSSRRPSGLTLGGALAAAVLCAALFPAAAMAVPSQASRSWLRNPGMVAHAMGGLRIQSADGKSHVYAYTNTLEAFEQNYSKGYRIFEVDLIPTSDSQLVARHDWSKGLYKHLGQKYSSKVPTRAKFMATKVLGHYTPLDVKAVARLMRKHPDMYIITDTKGTKTSQVRAEMRMLRSELGPDRNELSKRVIIQIYNEPMLKTVRSVYRFQNIIYTLYQLQTTTTRAVQFSKAHDIPVIVYDMTRWSPRFAAQIRRAGIASALHTINKAAIATQLRSYRVRYIYSDALPGGASMNFKSVLTETAVKMPKDPLIGKHGE